MERQTGKQQPTTTGPESKDNSYNQVKGAFKLVDYRPEAAVQRKLGQMMNNSKQVQKATQMQALANEYTARELPLIQQKEAVDTARSNELVVQRSPQDWQTDATIVRTLGHKFGSDQTWRSVKQEIRNYKALDRINTAQRTAILDELSRLLTEWENKTMPTGGSQLIKANRINAEIPQLKNLITTERNEIVEDQLANDYYTNNAVQVPIPAALSAGLNAPGLGIPAKAQILYQNIINFPFRYTGNSLPPNTGYQAHQGDCTTLSRMYVDVAGQHGIPAQQRALNEPHLVTPRAVKGRAAQANTHGNTHWYFSNHMWVDVQGTAFDLLFMVSPPPAVINKVADRTFRGVQYIVFANGSCLITEREFRKLRPKVNGQGRVFTSEFWLKAYVLRNVKLF